LTATYMAAQDGHLEVLVVLADAGAHLAQKTHKGSSPVGIAAQNGNLDVLRFLADRGASLHEANHDGWSVAHAAAHGGSVDVLRYLKAEGVDLGAPRSSPRWRNQARTRTGRNAMCVAFDEGQYEAMWFLMHGDDLEYDEDWDPWVGDSAEDEDSEEPFWRWGKEWMYDEEGWEGFRRLIYSGGFRGELWEL